MDNLKRPLSFSEQVNKLKSHGMIVEDETAAENILKQINYYRFTGYALQFRMPEKNSDYARGTSFYQVYRIYSFDEAIRDVCRRYIEIAEVYYRTQIAYGFSMSKCASSPHDQHYDESNFYNKDGYRAVMNSFLREHDYHKDSLVVKHHDKKYNGKLPLWAMVELMSFSSISKLYSSMYYSEKDTIAAAVNTGRNTLENHLHCLSVLRNKCAHAARLYNTKFSPPVKFPKSFLRTYREVRNDSMFAYILMLSQRLPDISYKASFVSDVLKIINEFQEDIDLSLIGFPQDFECLLHNACK